MPNRWPPGITELALPPNSFVAVLGTGEIVYRTLRIGRTEPDRPDFESNRERGKPRAPDEDYADYQGLSAYEKVAQAFAAAVRFPKVVVGVRLDPGMGSWSRARTSRRSRGT